MGPFGGPAQCRTARPDEDLVPCRPCSAAAILGSVQGGDHRAIRADPPVTEPGPTTGPLASGATTTQKVSCDDMKRWLLPSAVAVLIVGVVLALAGNYGRQLVHDQLAAQKITFAPYDE